MSNVIVFTQNERNFIKNILEKHKEQTLPNLDEIEIRFGHFIDKKFISGVRGDHFFKLKNNLDKYTNKKEFFQQDYNFNSGTSTFRKTVVENKQDKYISKTRIEYLNIYGYNFRISKAKEVTITKSEFDSLAKNNTIFQRNKQRTTYSFEKFQVDLTIVNETFEVEIEITDPSCNYSQLIGMTTLILKTFANNFYLLNNYDSDLIRNDYFKLVKKNSFVGSQPISLKKDFLRNLNNYAVTDKADGDRGFLFINCNSVVVIINSNLQVFYTDLKTKLKNCLFDGEMVSSKDNINFYLFDVLFYENQDIRTDFLLKKRLDILQEFICKIENTENYKVNLKNFYFSSESNFLTNLETICKTRNPNYAIDGLIFTPIDKPYESESRSLKFKKSNEISIDFFTKIKYKSDSKIEMYLYVQDGNKNIIPFKAFPKSVIESNLIRDTFNNHLWVNNTVIEYVFDKVKSQFIPIRTRWDKTANKNKHGNYFKVADDILESIQENITIADLLKVFGKKEYLCNMRKFNNFVKMKTINEYSAKSAIDLACGRAGDLQKWIYNKTKFVYGFDIDQNLLNEAKRRYHKLTSSTNVQIECFYKCIDLAHQKISHSLKANVDLVNCQFAIHYFLNNSIEFDCFLSNVTSNLNNDGFFIGSFLDGYLLEKTSDIMDNNNLIFRVETLKKTETMFGNQIEVFMNSDSNIFNNKSLENLVYFDKIIEYLKSWGLELVITKDFSSFKNSNINLLSFEKQIIDFHKTFVFRYNSKKNFKIRKPIEIFDQFQKKVFSDLQERESRKIVDQTLISSNLKIFNNYFKETVFLKYLEVPDDLVKFLNVFQQKNLKLTETFDIKLCAEMYPELQFCLFDADQEKFIKYNEKIQNSFIYIYRKTVITEKENKETLEIFNEEITSWFIVGRKIISLFLQSDSIFKYIFTETLEEIKKAEYKTPEIAPQFEIPKTPDNILPNLTWKLKDLKDFCKTKKLAVSGTKQQLLDRITRLQKLIKL